MLANGRRCPNAALPGSRYCGLDSHQALANIDSDRVEDLARIGEQPPPAEEAELEVEAIADDEGDAPGEQEAEFDDEAVGVQEESVQQPAEAAPGEAAEEPRS